MNEKQETMTRGLPVAESVHGLEFIQYQDGSVVSREIIKRPNGNVTMFAFDAGQELTEHTSSFDALVQLMEGEAELVISGKAVRAKVGDLVLMPANQPHAVKAIAKFKMLLTMIRS